MTDDMAAFYLENGWGRKISKDEALTILREGDRDGRIIQIMNSKNGENICSCCMCGCGMLAVKAKFPGPSAKLWSNYYAVVDSSACKMCGKCLERCQFNAISQKDGKITINTEKCLGCGLCVSTCVAKAMSLVRKPDERLYEPPETYDDAMDIWAASHAGQVD